MLSDTLFFDVGMGIMVSANKYSVFLSEGLIKLKSGEKNSGTSWRLRGIWISSVSLREHIKITRYVWV